VIPRTESLIERAGYLLVFTGWERSPYRTGLRPMIPANREKYREIYKNRPVAG
jgi:hypothetical protein